MVIEIQDDETRRNAKLTGQQLVRPAGSFADVLAQLHGWGYEVTALEGTWDYLALHIPSSSPAKQPYNPPCGLTQISY